MRAGRPGPISGGISGGRRIERQADLAQDVDERLDPGDVGAELEGDRLGLAVAERHPQGLGPAVRAVGAADDVRQRAQAAASSAAEIRVHCAPANGRRCTTGARSRLS